MNLTPIQIKPRILTTAIDLYDGTASLSLAFSVAKKYGVEQKQAVQIAKEVENAIKTWKEEAKYFHISSPEIERMASAFEHEDLAQAISL